MKARNRRGARKRALRDKAASSRRRALLAALKAGYQARGARDLELAAEWFPLEEEAWRLAKRP